MSQIMILHSGYLVAMMRHDACVLWIGPQKALNPIPAKYPFARYVSAQEGYVFCLLFYLCSSIYSLALLWIYVPSTAPMGVVDELI